MIPTMQEELERVVLRYEKEVRRLYNEIYVLEKNRLSYFLGGTAFGCTLSLIVVITLTAK